MPIQHSTWYPDTCNCVLRYSFDSDAPPPRTHTVSFVNKTCNEHKPLLPNTVVTYNTVMEENNRKANTFRESLQTLPADLADTIMDDNGVVTVELKPNLIFHFFYTGTAPNRVLTISFLNSNLNANKKNQLQKAIDNKIGAGKVVVQ